MRNYLSFGGGVNSVALHLYLLDEGWNFESVFVNHGTDWPETYEYLEMFQEWLQKHGYKPIVVLKPDVGTIEKRRFQNLYDYLYFKSLTPSIQYRACTDRFKIDTIRKYVTTPCFMLLGIDMDESKRAKLSSKKGIEHRFPLIEAGMNRNDCKEYIRQKGLPVPIKSGCFICPFQRVAQWIELRNVHPELFCKAQQLEKKSSERRGKNYFISGIGKPLNIIVDENQRKLFEVDKYPPCNCML